MTNEQIEALVASGTREGNGVWVNIGNRGAKMYVPDNVAPGESGLIYFYDSDPSTNSYGMRDTITGNNYNKIAIFLGCGDYDEGYLDIIDSVASYKGVGSHVNQSMGASAGAANGLHMKIASIKKNNETNQTVVLLECAYNGKGDGYLNITSDDIATLKNSNSGLLFIEEWYRDYDQGYNLEAATYLEDVAKAGVPVVVAHYKDPNKFHMVVVDEFVKNSNILDYLDGKASLTNIDNFTFSYCDNTGSWHHNKSFTEATAILGKSALETAKSLGITSGEEVIIPNADFSSLSNSFGALKNLMYDQFGNLYSNLVKSDENYAEYSVGQLLTTIAGTTFLNGINNSNYQSTTNIPKEEDYIINKYFTITGSLLEKTSKELQNAIGISDTIQETDNKLENIVNDNNNIGTIPGTLPSTSSPTTPSVIPNYPSDISEPDTGNDTENPTTTPEPLPDTKEETRNNSNNTSAPSYDSPKEEEPIIPVEEPTNDSTPSTGYIPKDPDIKEPTDSSKNNQTVNIPSSNVTPTTKKEDSGISPLGVILGAGALGGAGYAGKKIYDKVKQDKEDEEE